jgi:serine/threonine-protein kinase
MRLAAGERLGAYEILAPIGAGGMGEVYKARDTRLDRTVAIKVSKEQFSERFEREARSIAALNHPHICQLYDVGPDYLVMEYIDGAPLKGPLPLDQAMKYAGQICDALDAAHRKGITHRDLKPANIMVTKAGVKLLDFGLARITSGSSGSGDETITMAVMGTPAYMSPEQWDGKPGDARSDIYAFGCVLYEMLTGKRVAKERSAVEPGAIEHIIERCLAKDPDDRWQSARDVRHTLEFPRARLSASNPWRERAGWMTAAVVALAAASYLLQVPRSAGVPPPQPSVRLDLDLGPDVSLGSLGPAVALSPDGTRMVFVSEGSDGVRRLFTRRLDQAKATLLAKTEGAFEPFLSPDGESVGFFAQGKLKTTRIEGGEPVSLWDAPAGRGASWAEDGNIVAALDTQNGLSLVPVDGGHPVPLTNLAQDESTHRWPQVLPGGKAVLFNASVAPANYDGSDIAVVSLKDHRRKTVIEHAGMYPRYLSSGHLVYVTKGALYAVPFNPDRWEVRGSAKSLLEVSSNPSLGTAQIDFSRTGTMTYRSGETELVRTLNWLDGIQKSEVPGFEPAVYLFPRFSPDGSRLAYSVSQGLDTDLWICELDRGGKRRLTRGGYNAFPVWSADSQFLVFQSAGGIHWTRADGAGKPQPLLQDRATLRPHSFTNDGRLVFSAVAPGGAEIRTVSVENRSGQLHAGEPQVILKTATTSPLPAFSPDGRWLAYGDAEGAGYEVYVRAFPDNGTQVQQISNAGGVIPMWSQTGSQLFYRTEDQRIMVADYTVKAGVFKSEKPRLWSRMKLADIGLTANLDLHPDGKRFVALLPAEGPQPAERRSHVMLVTNFLDEVRRRMAGQDK